MGKRDQAVLAALVIGLLIGAGATYGLGAAILSRTDTLTTTALSTSLITTTVTSVQLYKVTFNETGGCAGPNSPDYYGKWYVTMDNITIVQPSNVTLSQIVNPVEGRDGQQYKEISTIVFTVPDGNYSYYASDGLGATFHGFVAVSGSDEVVPIMTGPYCP